MKKCRHNQLAEFKKGDSAIFEDTGMKITFTGASTATLDNDDVISDAGFIITYNKTSVETAIECRNGRTGIYENFSFFFILEFADGYNQFCGLTVNRK